MILLILKLVLGWMLLLYCNFWLDKPLYRLLVSLPSRMKLAALAICDLRNVIYALIISAIVYVIAMNGWLTGLNEFFNSQGTPSGMILWIIQPSFMSLLFFGILGFMYGFIGRGFGFSVLLGMVFLIPGLISVPAVCVLVFSEMSGQSWSFFQRLGRDFSRSVRLVRLGIQIFCFLAFWAGGMWIRGVLQSFDLNTLLLADRLWEVASLCAGLVFLDTALAMLFFHFYFQRTKGQTPIKA